MARVEAQRNAFDDRLARIKKGNANTMGAVQIGPRDEKEAGISKPTNTVRVKRKKATKVNIGEGSNLVFGLIAVVIGALSMVVGQATEFHLFQEGGLFPVTLPIEGAAQYTSYFHIVFGGLLAILFGWAFGLSNMIRRVCLIAGLAVAVVWQAELVERYPGLYSAIFTEDFVTKTLG